MTDMPGRPPTSAAHAGHDVLLVSRLVFDDDLTAEEHAQAEALVASCADCRRLRQDLRIVSRAVALEAVPPRPRDFRLGPERAARLRGSAWQRFLRRFAPPDGARLRPLAGSATALGVLLIVAGTVSPLVPGLATAPAPGADSLTELFREAGPTAIPTELDVRALGNAEFGLAAGSAQGGEDRPAASEAPVGDAAFEERLAEAIAASPTSSPTPPAPLDEAIGAGATKASDAADGAIEVAASGDDAQLVVFAGIVVAGAGLILLLLVSLAGRATSDPLLR
jgi:hypothetical protein